MTKNSILPPTYLLIAVLLMVGLFLIFPGIVIVPSPWNFIGLIPLVFGVWINLAADKSFHKLRTTVKPFEEPAIMITNGAFTISRNPMYLGFTSILTGIALLLRTLTPFIVVILFAIFMDQKYIKVEEQNMAKKFGQAWNDYKKKVKRWI